MQPNDNRQLTVTPRNQSLQRTDRDRAAEIMRQQIDRIYDEPQQNTPQQSIVESSPYEQTHNNNTGHSVSAAQWQRYHSAWQQYYQQYYDRYYRAQHARVASQQGAQTTPVVSSASPINEPITEDKAIDEIKNDLRSKIQHHGKKIRKSRHFVPVISALVVMSLFLFLQYNRVIIGQVKTFISPGSIAAQNIIVDPTIDVKVGPEPRMVIPKINVDAPVVYDVPNLAEATVQNALKSGIIHYPIPGASANPGQVGNAVFLGHSSNDVFDDGGYKFIFVQLEQMKKNDTFYINYNGTRYTYSVTSTETILPTEVSKLIVQTDKPLATLVTCTPVGTAQKRFIVHAEQISPDPKSASAASAQPDNVSQPPVITGNSPTLFDRLFGF